MARFDVYRMPDGTYALDCQADGFQHFNTRFAVPLRPIDDAPIAARRLNPVFTVEGRDVVMVTQFAAAIALRVLGDHVASLADHDAQITAALDMLLTGY